VCPQLLDIEDRHVVGGEDALQADQREVAEVLVVDGVELVAFDQALQMRELERHGSRRLKQRADPGDERVQIRNLREHVVAQDEIGLAALQDELDRELAPEELDQRLDAPGRGRLSDIGRGLDAQRRDALLDEVLEQVAVVAPELDDEALGPEREPVGDHRDVVLRVLEPRRGERREVGVLGEDAIGSDVLVELHEEAVGAHPNVKRIERLHSVERVGRHVALAQRRHAQIHESSARR